MPGEIHVADTTLIERTITDQDGTAVDISTATTKVFKISDPDGNVANVAASFTTDGTDGKMRATVTTSQWDEGSNWKLQCYVVLSSGSQYHSQIEDLHVHRNLS